MKFRARQLSLLIIEDGSKVVEPRAQAVATMFIRQAYFITIARLSSSSISVVRSAIVCPYLEVLHVDPGINSRPGHRYRGGVFVEGKKLGRAVPRPLITKNAIAYLTQQNYGQYTVFD